jgi:hypothetical protein
MKKDKKIEDLIKKSRLKYVSPFEQYLTNFTNDLNIKMDSDVPAEVQKTDFGNWQIKEDGSLYNSSEDYLIESDRLKEGDWIPHLYSKAWMENGWNDFIPAYMEAIKISEKEKK